MNIDWDKAPEGATHYYKDSPQPWRDLSGYNWKYFSAGEWHSGPSVCTSAELMREIGTVLFAKPLPQLWTAEGLPPVGVVCEYRVGDGTWFQCEIRYVTSPGLFETVEVVMYPPHLKGEQIGEVGTGPGKVSFRPIRTPEQIAAEERQKELDSLTHELYRDIGMDPRDAEILFNKGYRKQVQP